MAAGDVLQHHFTIVEGWTFRQLRAAWLQDAGLQQTMATVDDGNHAPPAGRRRAAGGWFLPETTAT
jgi:UPF0755 protein